MSLNVANIVSKTAVFLFIASFCLPSEASYYTYYNFESSCNVQHQKTIVLIKNSTGIIRATETRSYSGGLNCQLYLTQAPPGYGTLISLQDVDLRRDFLFCHDFLKISNQGKSYFDGCTYTVRKNYMEAGSWMITFTTVPSRVYNYNFKIVYTVYHKPPCMANEFQCSQTDVCIPESLTCDGINNCGDESDEWSGGGAACHRGSIIGGSIGGVIFFLIVVALLVFLYRRKRTLVRTTVTTTSTPYVKTM